MFLTSLVVRVAFIFVFHIYTDLDRYELERTALSLAQTGVYGNPYAIPTGPTAHVSPGYTLILAAIFKIFGTAFTAEIVKNLVASFVTSLQYALLPLVAVAFSLNPSVGVIAGLLCAIYPTKPLIQVNGDWETPYTALSFCLVCLLVPATWKSSNISARRGLVSGLLWGISLLFASVVLPIYAAAIVAGAWFQRRSMKTYIRFAALELSVVILCLLPWVIRNQIALGSPIATRSNLGLELRVSNNDFATSDQRINAIIGVYNRFHPLQNVAEAQKVKAMGEVAYNREEQRLANEWIETHLQKYFALTIGRVRDFWFYKDPTSWGKTIFLAITGAAGLVGAALLFWKNPVSGAIVWLILMLYPAPSYFIHVGLRQRYPIDWLLTLLSVYLAQLLLRSQQQANSRQ